MSNLIYGRRRGRWKRRSGFTLLEVLIATVVTLILTALVVEMFAVISDGIFNSRANIEISDQLRNAKHRLIQDLRGVTAPTIPPLDPSMGCGYFEYVEGGNVANTIGGDVGSGTVTKSTGGIQNVNTINGDLDDILMFTTASFDDLLVGRFGSGKTHRSRFAEVAWFVRLVPSQPFCTLHRRIFLVDPQMAVTAATDTHAEADMSGRQQGGAYENIFLPTAKKEPPGPQIPRTVRNSLGDLTMRERRSLHQPNVWPYEMFYAVAATSTAVINNAIRGVSKNWPVNFTPMMGLPAMVDAASGGTPLYTDGIDSFVTPALLTNTTQQLVSYREAEDVILTNVVSFDVKAWDPGAPVFRAASPPGGNANVVGLIVPGDGGYGGDGQSHNGTLFPKGALYNFIEKPTTVENQPVAFGAYVDLNYMWLNGQSGEDNVVGSNSLMSKYFKALRFYTQSGKVVRTDNLARLPRPSFAFATPGRVLSGYPIMLSGSYRGQPDHKATSRQYPAVWDTWSRHYEYDGINNDGDFYPGTTTPMIDEGTDGIDNNGNGYIDEPPVAADQSSPADGIIDGSELFNAEGNGERDAPPPYDAPLRGIKVTIRVLEQDSRQVRELSTVHEFIPY